MRPDSSGADLVKQALHAATTLAERQLAHEAAARASFEIAAMSASSDASQGLSASSDNGVSPRRVDPVLAARRAVVAELHAAAIRADCPPPPADFPESDDQEQFEEELETARRFSARIVKESLRPPPE